MAAAPRAEIRDLLVELLAKRSLQARRCAFRSSHRVYQPDDLLGGFEQLQIDKIQQLSRPVRVIAKRVYYIGIDALSHRAHECVGVEIGKRELAVAAARLDRRVESVALQSGQTGKGQRAGQIPRHRGNGLQLAD